MRERHPFQSKVFKCNCSACTVQCHYVHKINKHFIQFVYVPWQSLLGSFVSTVTKATVQNRAAILNQMYFGRMNPIIKYSSYQLFTHMAMRRREVMPIGHKIDNSFDLFFLYFAYQFNNYTNWHIPPLTADFRTHHHHTRYVFNVSFIVHLNKSQWMYCMWSTTIDTSEFSHPQMNDEMENNSMEVVGLKWNDRANCFMRTKGKVMKTIPG